MENTILILNHSHYEFTNEKTGEVMKGVKIAYVTNQKTLANNAEGYDFIKESCDYSLLPKLKGAGLYKAILSIKVDKNNISRISITDLQFINSVNLGDLWKTKN
ncbi:MAG: hypothetical protein ACRC7N_20050 [Clostridium sp.]